MDKRSLAEVSLAVVGMACRLPGASNLEEYWRLIESGGDATGELPNSILDRELYYDARYGIRGKSYTAVGGMCPKTSPDPSKCRLPDEVLANYDEAHVTMCEVAHDALQDAGYDPFHLRTRSVGVYFGHTCASRIAGDLVYAVCTEQTAQYLHEIQAAQGLSRAERSAIIRTLVADARAKYDHRRRTPDLDLSANNGAQLIARAFGLDGPCIVVDAACASSIFAMLLGVRALQLGSIDMAVIGGASYLKSDSLVLFSAAQSVARGKSCPFDQNASGLVTSEGYVALAIKTLPRAIADGNQIRAVIRSIGLSADGRGKSLWAPMKTGQILAMKRAYQGSIRPQELQYIEAHATSTQVGDATELTALVEAFPRQISANRKIPLGSVKGNIGHTLETAGVASLTKVILAMEHGIIPPVANLNEPNSAVVWDNLPFYLPRTAEPWPQPTGGTRKAAVNTFGIGGLNAHVVVEEYDDGKPASYYQASRAEDNSSTERSEPIAVIGSGVILPGARTLDAFWNLLQSGVDPKTDVTPERWNADVYYDPHGEHAYRTRNKRGGFLTDYQYDWRRCRVPPKQIEKANPLQFMLLDATEQALRQAGYLEKSFNRDRVGVVVGTIFGGDFSNDLQMGLRLPEFQRDLARLLRDRKVPAGQIQSVLTQFADMLLKHMPALLDETGSFTSSTLASRITKTFDFRGGAFSMDGGIGSGLAALDACVNLLRAGDCDVMVCAAGQRNMDIMTFESLDRFGALAVGDPLPGYDARSSGYLPGEGCAVLLLRRLSDARRDGDQVLAVVRSVSAAADFRHPGGALQASLQKAIHQAGIAPEEVRAVEAVGAVSSLAKLEVKAVRNVLATTDRREPIVISSLASQFGYTGGTHSLAGAIKASQGIASGCLPPGVATEHPDSQLFGCGRIVPQQRPVHLTPTDGAAVCVLCGPAYGVSYAAVLEPATKAVKKPQIVTPTETGAVRIVRLGAAHMTGLLEMLRTRSAEQLYESSAAFSEADRVRLAIVSTGIEDFRARLHAAMEQLLARTVETPRRLAAGGVYFGEVNPERRAVAFVFPGQGSQYPGMFSELTTLLPEARHAKRIADAAMRALGYPAFHEIAGKDAVGLGSDVWQTQVSMLLAEFIVDHTLRALGLSPVVVAGHSFGEYAALVSAGAWSLTDAIRGTFHRCQAITKTPGLEGCMAVTNAKPLVLKQVLASVGESVTAVNFNTPQQTVVSGQHDAVEEVVKELRTAGCSAMIIKVPCPFHSPLMRPAADAFAELVREIPVRHSLIPVISTVDARAITMPDYIVSGLVSQLVSPVNYMEMLDQILAFRPALVVEVGPQQVLTKLNYQNHPDDDVVFIAADNRRLHDLRSIWGVMAQAECLGCRPHQVVASVQPSQRDSAARLVVFDASKGRRERMRQRSETTAKLGEERMPGNQQAGGPIKSLYSVAATASGTTPAAVVERAVATSSPRLPTVVNRAASPAKPSVDAAEIRKILVDYVIEQTGYPKDIVQMDADLEADLGIDSIKKAQLFGEVGARFQIAPRADLSLDDFPTLGHVLRFLVAELDANPASREVGTVSPSPPASATHAKPNGKPHPAESHPAKPSVDAAEIRKILVDYVIEQTGYPEDIVQMDADLEADLGIDSIKKAQLFGEVGARFQIAPRADLSLDDFPTLGHVLRFLVAELDASSASQGTDCRPEDTVESMAPCLDLADDKPSQPRREVDDFVRLVWLAGSANQRGLQHGQAMADDVRRAVTILADSPQGSNGHDLVSWPIPSLEELRGIATGAEVNLEAVVAWNCRVDSFARWPVALGMESVSSEPVFESPIGVFVRHDPDRLPYVLIAKPGQIVPRAAVNAAGLVVSCELLDGDASAVDISVFASALPELLATCRTRDKAVQILRSLVCHGQWCVGVSQVGGAEATYLRMEADGIHDVGANELGTHQRAFHESLQQGESLLVANRRTGLLRRFQLAELLGVPDFSNAMQEESLPISDRVMQRHVMRMTASPQDQAGTSPYRAGDVVCVVGCSTLGQAFRERWKPLGCRVTLLSSKELAAEMESWTSQRPAEHLVFLEEETAPELDRFAAASYFSTQFEALRVWLQAMQDRADLSRASLTAVTRMGGDFGFRSVVECYTGGGWTGLLKAIRREFPSLRTKVVDFAPRCGAEEVTRCVQAELSNASSDIEVGYRDGARYVVAAIPDPVPAATRHIRRGGVWVVTGGGRGVTAVVAQRLGARFGLRLHLFGTTAIPDDNVPWVSATESELKQIKKAIALQARREGKSPADGLREVEKVRELVHNLRKFAEAGLTVTYHCCDVVDYDAVDKTLAAIRRTDGPIEGVIHGAGIESSCKFSRKQTSAVRRCIAAKCDGAANLIALTRHDPLRHFVTFGSTSGRFGGLGQTDYSLAADLLAKMTARLAVERPDCDCVCFHWPAWDDAGMAVRPEARVLLERANLTFMPSSEGAAHLLRELLAGAHEREILLLDKPGVLDTDGTMGRRSAVADPKLFCESPTVVASVATSSRHNATTQGDVSQTALISSLDSDANSGRHVATMVLDPLQDPFLIHHRFKGKPFLPGVITIESFAEAVALIEPKRQIVALSEVLLGNGLWLYSRKYEARILLDRQPDGYRCQLVGPFVNSEGQAIGERVYATALVVVGDEPSQIDQIDLSEPVLGWSPFVYPSDLHIVHGAPLQACKMLAFQHDGGLAKIVGPSPRELFGAGRAGNIQIACAALDAIFVACGVYSYCMLERCREIPGGVARYRQVRLPVEGEDCTLRFFYRGTNKDGNLYDCTLMGASGDAILEVIGYQTVRMDR